MKYSTLSDDQLAQGRRNKLAQLENEHHTVSLDIEVQAAFLTDDRSRQRMLDLQARQRGLEAAISALSRGE